MADLLAKPAAEAAEIVKAEHSGQDDVARFVRFVTSALNRGI
jgi:hypothetical protein